MKDCYFYQFNFGLESGLDLAKTKHTKKKKCDFTLMLNCTSARFDIYSRYHSTRNLKKAKQKRYYSPKLSLYTGSAVG
jgi:hypothetical protein